MLYAILPLLLHKDVNMQDNYFSTQPQTHMQLVSRNFVINPNERS